jgi:hypothetical protein
MYVQSLGPIAETVALNRTSTQGQTLMKIGTSAGMDVMLTMKCSAYDTWLPPRAVREPLRIERRRHEWVEWVYGEGWIDVGIESWSALPDHLTSPQ